MRKFPFFDYPSQFGESQYLLFFSTLKALGNCGKKRWIIIYKILGNLDSEKFITSRDQKSGSNKTKAVYH